YVLRNIEEIQLLHSSILQWINSNSAEVKTQIAWDMQTKILIIGSGALCMDSVSSILEGYTSAKKEKAFNENIPHITILSRRDVIGYPLLDLDASKMMTARLQTKLYSEHLSLVLGDEIDKIFYCTDGKRKLAVGVLTKKGKKIQCSC